MANSELLRMAWAHTWQLTLLAIAMMLLVRWFGRDRPHLAHVLWLVVLVKCLTPPLWTSPSGVFCWLQDSAATAPVVEMALEVRQPRPQPAMDIDRSESSAGEFAERLQPTPQNFEISPQNKSTESSLATGAHIHPWQILMAIWVFGVVSILSLAAVRWLSCWRTIRRAGVESREDLSTLLGNLAARLRLRKRVQLVITASRIGPAVVGIWRPVILLPAAVVHNKTAGDLEPILAHELMHVRRGDLWIGMWQVLAQSLWWFHPLVWLANRFLSRDAERCCDEEVIAELGCDPARYARSLLNVLELKRTLQPVPAFPGVRPVEVTSRRLERIMKLGQGCHKRTPWWCWLVMMLVAAVALPGAAFVAAGDKTKPNKPPKTVRDRDPSPTRNYTADKNGDSVISRTYRVKDVLERVQSGIGVNESDAKRILEEVFGSMAGSQPGATKPLFTWSGRKLVVADTDSGHERIADRMQFIRVNGFHQILIEVRILRGPQDAIDKLHSNWEVLDADPPARPTVNGFGLEPLFSFESQTLTDTKSRQGSVAEMIEKRKPALYAEIDDSGATSMLAQIAVNPQVFIVSSPKVMTITGQSAFVQVGDERSFVVNFKKTGADRFEPHVRVVPSGMNIQLRPLPYGDNRIRLEGQVELAQIRNVETRKVDRDPGQEPLTIELPEVTKTKLNLTYDIELGRTLLIGGLTSQDDGKTVSILVMLRCTKFDHVAQPSVSQASGTTAAPPAPVGPYSRVPNLQRSPTVYANPAQAAAAQAVPASSPASWGDRLRSFGISLQLPHPVRFNAANEKLELSAGRLRITFGDPQDPEWLEADQGVFLPPIDVSKKSEQLIVGLSGNVRLHSPGKMQACAERMRLQINGASSIAAVQMFQKVTVEGKEFSVRADEASLLEAGKIRLLGKVELCLKSDDGKPNEQTIRAEQIEWDMRAGVIRADGAVLSYLGDQRGQPGTDESATQADLPKPNASVDEPGKSSPKTVREIGIEQGLKHAPNDAKRGNSTAAIRKRTIAEALERKCTFAFKDATLKDMLLVFEKTLGIRVDMDEESLRAEGIALDQPRSLQLNDVTGLDALQQILKPLNLGIGITSDRLIIMSARKAQRNTVTKTYYVADLVVPIPDSVTLVVVNANDAKLASQPNLTNAVKPGTPDFETLIDLIVQTIRPDSWAKAGGSGAIESFPTNLSLVVSQTEGVHDQIADLLKQLRRLQDNQVSLEPRIVGLPADFFERIGVDIENKTSSTSPKRGKFPAASQINSQVLNAIQGDPRAKIMSQPKMTLFNGQTVVLQFGSEGERLSVQLRPVVSPDRRSVTIHSSVGDSAKNPLEVKDPQTEVPLVDGDTMMIDLTESLRPESLGWSASRGVPMLDKIPYIEKLFKNTPDHAIERMYLLVTPRIIIQEEEEQKLGIDLTP